MPSTRPACSPSITPMLILLRQARTLRSIRLYSIAANKEAILEHATGTDAGISYLTLNRASSKNAISTNLLREMSEAVQQVRFNPSTRVLILRSAVPGSFCAGADLKERKTMSQLEVSKFLHGLRSLLGDLESLPMPTLAAIDGPALGGGLELALSCDMRVAGESVDKIGLTETRLAIIPGAGGTQRLTRLLGLSLAKELIFTAKILTASQALKIGLVNHVASPGESASDRATALAREILPNGPMAVQAAKLAISQGAQLDLESGLEFERQCYGTILHTKDRLEGLQAFAEKRKPVYQGH